MLDGFSGRAGRASPRGGRTGATLGRPPPDDRRGRRRRRVRRTDRGGGARGRRRGCRQRVFSPEVQASESDVGHRLPSAAPAGETGSRMPRRSGSPPHHRLGFVPSLAVHGDSKWGQGIWKTLCVQLRSLKKNWGVAGDAEEGRSALPGRIHGGSWAERRYGGEGERRDGDELQTEKIRHLNLILQKIDGQIKCINEMCNMMSLDLKKTLYEVHPSFVELVRIKSMSISDTTLDRLAGKVHALNQEKKQRLRKLQDLGSTLIELWSLMDTPLDEHKCSDHVTSLISVSQNTVMPQGCLAHDLIEKTI